ncbi:TfuA-like protein [Dongia sp.]|uniref:TfuA-like protein n=1 Tax=Dongia sp. TaxID=1977262 RepID=UPI0035B393D4
MTKRILFIGPSLHGAPGPLPAGIDCRPPAAKGDLLAAVFDGATSIGFVDGTFDHGASTWHKEILFALNQGVRVLGAASMGALRAAECAAFGVIGIGTIYADYAAGRRTADEDVALMHGPAELGFPPLTEALVDIDATLEYLLSQGHIGAAARDRLAAGARALHFKDRRWECLCEPSELARLRPHFVNRKRADALLLIDALASTPEGPSKGIPSGFTETLFFTELHREVLARSRQAGS